METLVSFVNTFNGWVWGPPMLLLIAATGLFLFCGLKGLTLRKLGFSFSLLFHSRQSNEAGDISPFHALMTSLSATLGTGNIAGVATAIALGGPGALFWMWMIALVGMATKYAEAVCAVHFRERDALGQYVGGPMYYIKNGMGPKWHWLGFLFALFGVCAGFGIGNTVQANSVADALSSTWQIPEILTGMVLALLVAFVLLGGLKRIAQVAGKLIPFMGTAYFLVTLFILIRHVDRLPEAFALIFQHAFTPTASTGGFAGATVWAALRYGVARGIFSNEAGLGSAPIAHASAQTAHPVKQGTIAMLGTFIDTLIVCTLTGLVIIVTQAWQSGENGANLSTLAFSTALPSIGAALISLALALFAFTTLLGWSLYGERCAEYLFGTKAILPFRILWVLAIPLGALAQLDFIWLLADTLNALMAIPNLIALLALSPVVFQLSKTYFHERTDSTQ